MQTVQFIYGFMAYNPMRVMYCILKQHYLNCIQYQEDDSPRVHSEELQEKMYAWNTEQDTNDAEQGLEVFFSIDYTFSASCLE